ncbi:MAG: UDP-N-acetylglucosamine 2-epimerase [Bacteroidota bacterium]
MKLLFITGTRADFGKLKPLIVSTSITPSLDYDIFCTGMHMMAKYGNTVSEITKAGFKPPFTFINQIEGDSMEIALSNTIQGLSRFLHENSFDLIVVHGDRIEALAGASVGALRNIKVAHVEGGEISGTIDELLRHSITKLSHIHFVASDKARKRLIQLGEVKESIFKIGSPDVDLMLGSSLPTLQEVKTRYDIKFDKYAVACLHPVTSELSDQKENAEIFIKSLVESKLNYILIYPNNDLGSEEIFKVLESVKLYNKIQMFPSLRFEYFLSLLKNSDFIIGNSSTGIHEAPVYGIPTINIGSRQLNRLNYESILNVPFDLEKIKQGFEWAISNNRFKPCDHYGKGDSAKRFIDILLSNKISLLPKQKQFRDLE